MAKELIAVLRQGFPQLRRLPFYTAIELAHRVDSIGTRGISYQFLADRVRISKRTAQRHIQILIDLKLITKLTTRLKDEWVNGKRVVRYARNRYRFCIHWHRDPPHAYPSDKTRNTASSVDKLARILPPPEKEKESSLREEIDQLKKGMRLMIRGTDRYRASQEALQGLENMLGGTSPCPAR